MSPFHTLYKSDGVASERQIAEATTFLFLVASTSQESFNLVSGEMGSLESIVNLENNSSDIVNPLNPDEFRRQGHMIIDFLADYYQNIEKYPVLSQVEPGYLRKLLPMSAPYIAEPVEAILQDVEKHIIPGITHWQSPNYFAYFPSSGSVAGFLGEVLSTGFNVVGFNWISSPAATELESIVMDWLGQMLELPQRFLFTGNGGGVIQGTTCEAMLCTLTAARDQMLSKIGRENIGKLVVYGSDQTHSAVAKAAKIVGIDPKNFRAIKTNKSTSFGLSPESLRFAITKDVETGLIPLYLCATVGTTSTTAVDPLRPLCDVAKEYGVWVHVDAAYAGSACICPEFRHFINGVEGANSFSLNAHKWFFTTLDCCCLWVKDPSTLTKSLSTNPEYLKNKASDSKQVVDYKDWQVTLSRRFRAMKLWLVLRSYGVANLRNFLRSHVKMAKRFEELLASDNRFEVVVPRYFATVCFRVLPSALCKIQNEPCGKADHHVHQKHANEFNRKLLESINASGHMYMTHAQVEGIYMIRFAVGATLTEDKHVTKAWEVVREMVDTMLKLHPQ
ncbi:Pyridoxal phosphate-dependent decarboxylase - like 5 [Theobroma cacao]|nr:Pyridoxal phosphate-dependent decarboxylase - like 5 [Theobroma cacao]